MGGYEGNDGSLLAIRTSILRNILKEMDDVISLGSLFIMHCLMVSHY